MPRLESAHDCFVAHAELLQTQAKIDQLRFDNPRDGDIQIQLDRLQSEVRATQRAVYETYMTKFAEN